MSDTSDLPTFRCPCGGTARPIAGPKRTVISNEAGEVVAVFPFRGSQCDSCEEKFYPADPAVEAAAEMGLRVTLKQTLPTLEILKDDK